MAESGNDSRTAAQIISASLEDLGVVIPGGTSADSTLALQRLNHIVKQWQCDAHNVN